MQKRIVTLLAFIGVVAASFYLGTFVDLEPNGSTETNETLAEIMGMLQSNHYTQPEEDILWQGAIEGMIESVDDPYTTYFSYEEYQNYQSSFSEEVIGIGVSASSLDGHVVVEVVVAGGPADNAGILPNDIIVEVDGEDRTGMNFYDAIVGIKGEEGTEVSIGVIRQGFEDIIRFTMVREVIDYPTITYTTYPVGDKTIGYIEVTTFGDETANLFSQAINILEQAGIDGLVVDLRNNGGGHLFTVVNMLQLFLIDNDKPMFSIEYYANGLFTEEAFDGEQSVKKPYEIVTLVNENSASASEVFASSMQEHGGYPVIGTSTFGKGTMQTDKAITSTDADLVHITIGKWITSDGNWVHFDGGTDGVQPDVLINTTKYDSMFKLFLFDGETIAFDTVDSRIENVQYILNAMGYDVREDGYFDLATKNAILDIQDQNSLTENGEINSEVLVVLNNFVDTYKENYVNDTQLNGALDYFNE